MSSSANPYAILGLEPDADRAAVDRAYSALMKRHHPDRGGDADKAATINRAYQDITRPAPVIGPVSAPSDLAFALYARRTSVREAQVRAAQVHLRAKRRRWPLWVGVAVLFGAFGWAARDSIAETAWNLQWRYFQPSGMDDVSAAQENAAMASDSTTIDFVKSPISDKAIRAALAEARSAVTHGGMAAASDASGLCYQQFVKAPSLERYDHCVALDDAILFVAGAVSADRGGFSAAALTARQLAAGRMLAGDYDTIEERIDHIRLKTLRGVDPLPDLAPMPETPIR